MKLEGLKANFLGDSITQGIGVPDETYAYWRVLERKFGLSVARGYGISGTRIARQKVPVPGKPAYFDRDFCSRVEEMDEDADLVVVFGGTNDFGRGDAPFGELSDNTVDTYCGACRVLMEKLINRYPTAKIVFMTPLHRVDETRPDKHPLCDYVHAQKQIAEFYGIPVLDLYATSGIVPAMKVSAEAFAPDGVHPNIAGAERIADRLGYFLLSL